MKNKGIDYSLKLFDFISKLPKNEDLYGIKNYLELNENELNKVYADVKNYMSNYTFLKDTFTIRDNKPQYLRADYEPFGENNNARWFLVFDDVKDFLMEMHRLWLNGQMSESYIKAVTNLKTNFDEKIKDRVKIWNTKYEKQIKEVTKHI